LIEKYTYNIATEDNFLSMAYHFTPCKEEYLFVMDEQRVLSIDLKTNKVVELFSIDERVTSLTSMVGHYSTTVKKFFLFLGDRRGQLNKFDPDECLIVGELEMFPKKPQKEKKQKEITGLVWFHDRREEPCIAAYTINKKTIAVFNQKNNKITHFKFDEKVTYIAPYIVYNNMN
jgi:hypothetical protein